MKLKNFHDLFVHELKDLINAERQIREALPRLARAAESPMLAEAFEMHQAETEQQIERLESIFNEMGLTPRGTHCPGAEGLIKEGEELIENAEDPQVLDAGLITAGQRVEHYEIAAYGTAIEYARLLELPNAVALLEQSLEEEKATDRKLTEIAESVNRLALSAYQESASRT